MRRAVFYPFFVFSVALLLGVVQCSKSDEGGAAAPASLPSLEARSGLGTYELYTEKRSLWNDDSPQKLIFLLNAGPQCFRNHCTVDFEVSLKEGKPFKKLGEFSDDGQGEDLLAEDGVYTATVDFTPSGYQDLTLRFRAVAPSVPFTSNVVFLTIGPRIKAADVQAFLTTIQSRQADFRATDPSNAPAMEAIAAQLRTQAGVSDAQVARDGSAIVVLHQKRFFGMITRGKVKGLSPAGDDNEPAVPASGEKPQKACGGWEGEALFLSPFHYEFGSDDAVAPIAKVLQEDPDKRFHVQHLKGSGKFGASLSWYQNLFEKRNIIGIHAHGATVSIALNDRFRQVAQDGEVQGDTLALSVIQANVKFEATEESLRLLTAGIAVSPEGESFLLPRFFSQQKGSLRRNSFVYLASCFSTHQSMMEQAFMQRGARVVIGYDHYLPTGSWQNKNAENIADTLLKGKPIHEVPTDNPHIFTVVGGSAFPAWLSKIYGEQVAVSMTVHKNRSDEEGANGVRFFADSAEAPALTVKAKDQAVGLKPAGCRLQKALIEGLGENWICSWSRTGQTDSTPKVDIIFRGKEAPTVGKTYGGVDAHLLYGDRACGAFDSFAYPELLQIKVEKWAPGTGVRLQFQGTVSNNAPLGTGPGSLEFFALKEGSGTNFLLD